MAHYLGKKETFYKARVLVSKILTTEHASELAAVCELVAGFI